MAAFSHGWGSVYTCVYLVCGVVVVIVCGCMLCSVDKVCVTRLWHLFMLSKCVPSCFIIGGGPASPLCDRTSSEFAHEQSGIFKKTFVPGFAIKASIVFLSGVLCRAVCVSLGFFLVCESSVLSCGVVSVGECRWGVNQGVYERLRGRRTPRLLGMAWDYAAGGRVSN